MMVLLFINIWYIIGLGVVFVFSIVGVIVIWMWVVIGMLMSLSFGFISIWISVLFFLWWLVFIDYINIFFLFFKFV